MLYSSQDTVKATIEVQDSTPRFRKFNEAEVDSIFKMLERREQMLDSIARAEARMRYLQSLKPPPGTRGIRYCCSTLLSDR